MAIANYSKQFTVTAFTMASSSGHRRWLKTKTNISMRIVNGSPETGRDFKLKAAGTAARIEHRQLLLKQLFFSCSF